MNQHCCWLCGAYNLVTNILVIYCVMNHPHTEWYKSIPHCAHSFVGQEFGYSVEEWFRVMGAISWVTRMVEMAGTLCLQNQLWWMAIFLGSSLCCIL